MQKNKDGNKFIPAIEIIFEDFDGTIYVDMETLTILN
jgi:hypothetical protein